MNAARLFMVLFVLQVAVASPQTQPQGAPPERASLQGIVLKMGAGEPVSKATVILSRFEGRGDSYIATTNSGGQFLFQNLEPGQYRLSASRNGYVRSEYGARSPNRPGLPISIAAGQRMTELVLQIMPAGTLTGRVFDRDGEPLANATVQALKYSYQEGQRLLNSVQQARTNDLGEYRLFWLAPGQYFVSATYNDNNRNPFLGGPVAGPGIGIVIAGGRGGGGRGAVFAGRGGSAPAPISDQAEEGYIPVYYPGTTAAQSAAPINLPAGVTFSGIDLTVTAVRTVRVRGRVINGATGQPVQNANIMLLPRPMRLRSGLANNRNIDAQGNFEIRGVAPGSYDVVAILNDRNNRTTARVPLEIGSADVENVALVLSPGLMLPGKLALEGTTTNSADQDLKRMRVMLRPNAGVTQIAGAAPASPVQADGSFALQQVGLDDYRLSVTGMPQGAYVKMARLGATDVLNDGLRIDRQTNGGLEILVSLNSGSLDGTVVNEKQEPAANVTVVLVPDAIHRGRLDLYRTAATDGLGHFQVAGIPPGDYKAFAWEDVETGAWQDPDFIRLYENFGKPLRIGERSQTNIELRLIPAQM